MLRTALIIALVLAQSVSAEAAGKKAKKKGGKAAKAEVTQPVAAPEKSAATSATTAPAEAKTAEPTPAAAPASPAPAEAASPAPQPATTTAAAPAKETPSAPASETHASSTRKAVHDEAGGNGRTESASYAPPTEAASAEQASRPGRIGVSAAPKLGGTLPTSKLKTTYMAGLELGYNLPFKLPLLGGVLGVAAEFDYLSPQYGSSHDSPSAGEYKYELDQRILMLAVDALARIPLGDLTPYGGVGYGMYILRAKMDAFEQVNTESQSRSGLQLRGGCAYTFGPGEAFAEVRYHYVGLRFDTTGDSNGGGISAALGYRFQI